MNPQHNVPFMKDGDHGINESRAIASYIDQKYNNSKLHPLNDAKLRSEIDQKLYFDMGVFYKSFGDCIVIN